MPTFGAFERRMLSYFKRGTQIYYNGRNLTVVEADKPTCYWGEPKTDIYVAANDEFGTEEIKISYKKTNADFLENKTTAERAENILGENWRFIIERSTTEIADRFLKRYRIYKNHYGKSEAGSITLGWRFELLRRPGGDLSGEISLSPDQVYDVYAGFMKGILVKRLESSFHAFRMTLSRFIDSYEKFIHMAESGKVYISKKVDVYDLLDDGNIEKLMYLIEQQDVMEFKTTEFEARFIKELHQDLAQLQYLQGLWNLIKTDPKLDEFKRNLTQNRVMRGKKVIVFTESKETAEYLAENLKEIYGDSVIFFSGQSSQALKVEIEDSFNPKNADKNNDKYDLLITTDVLAEGINLHRANVLVNYDLPWNPTRIMQRVGRINRVGTAFDRIYVFNFFPTAQSEKQLPMEERILEKLQAFHDTLGEDFKYLSDEEDVSPKKLFSDLNKDMDADEESANPELGYLAIIRQIRDNDPILFSQIKRLPKKAKSGKSSEYVSENSTIGFIRKGALKTFFQTNGETKQLSFMEAIKLIQSEPDEPKVSIGSDFYDQYDKNSEAFDYSNVSVFKSAAVYPVVFRIKMVEEKVPVTMDVMDT